MAKQSPSEQLDIVLSGLLGPPAAPLPRAEASPPFDPSISPLIQLIGALRDLPRPDFKVDLKANLERRASMASAPEPAVNFVRPGFHTVTPYLIISGAAQWIDFVKQAYGAEEKFRAQRPGSDAIMHAEVQIGDSMIELADANPQYPAMPMTLLLRVSDPDAIYERALAAGATSTQPVADRDYGVRGGSLRDACGNSWDVSRPAPGNKIFEDFRSVTPHFNPVRSAEFIEFLQKAFGGEEIYRAESPEGRIFHAQVRIGDSIIGMGDAHGPYQPMPGTLHLYVPDTDALYEQALRAGAESIQPPADQPYGDRSAGVRDPFGNRWFIATHMRDVAP
jgi:PhnB protein